jgi:hypothetical protein
MGRSQEGRLVLLVREMNSFSEGVLGSFPKVIGQEVIFHGGSGKGKESREQLQ